MNVRAAPALVRRVGYAHMCFGFVSSSCVICCALDAAKCGRQLVVASSARSICESSRRPSLQLSWLRQRDNCRIKRHDMAREHLARLLRAPVGDDIDISILCYPLQHLRTVIHEKSYNEVPSRRPTGGRQTTWARKPPGLGCSAGRSTSHRTSRRSRHGKWDW